MRFDIVSVFPDFFDVLKLSLVGKAQERGIMSVYSHDLRSWTDDPHRTVDDTPAGGGAGMVMRADVWGKALDSLIELQENNQSVVGVAGSEIGACDPSQGDQGAYLGQGTCENNTQPRPETREKSQIVGEAKQRQYDDKQRQYEGKPKTARTVLAIPTPAGVPLTQRLCEDLAVADHIVIACGRYEGIDSRVAQEYADRGVEVVEYSLGDYVLNGGEVAAVALIEAVGRLLPGMVGNPDSLVEESHGASGLLEYPVYTRPVVWKGREIPAVLTSGDHGAVARWRRQQAMERTARRRPDMLAKLPAEQLDKNDREYLASLGFLALTDGAYPRPVSVREALMGDLASLSDVAQRTFPDACPKDMRKEDIDSFIKENLSQEKFARYIESPQSLVMVLDVEGEILGYTLSHFPSDDEGEGEANGAPINFNIPDYPRRGPLIELSKFYLDPRLRGSGARGLLWESTVEYLRRQTSSWERPYVWLATNIANRRAQKAYVKSGFVYAGKRTFRVGEQNNVDRVYVRALNVA